MHGLVALTYSVFMREGCMLEGVRYYEALVGTKVLENIVYIHLTP